MHASANTIHGWSLQEAGCKGFLQQQPAAAQPEAVAAVCQVEQGLGVEGGPGLPPLLRNHTHQGHGQLAPGEDSLPFPLWLFHYKSCMLQGKIGSFKSFAFIMPGC